MLEGKFSGIKQALQMFVGKKIDIKMNYQRLIFPTYIHRYKL